LLKLVQGYHPALLLPRCPPAGIDTMPALYQMLPRSRHGALMDERGQPVDDIFDLQLWRQRGFNRYIT
jgi:hypothetical protein